MRGPDCAVEMDMNGPATLFFLVLCSIKLNLARRSRDFYSQVVSVFGVNFIKFDVFNKGDIEQGVCESRYVPYHFSLDRLDDRIDGSVIIATYL